MKKALLFLILVMAVSFAYAQTGTLNSQADTTQSVNVQTQPVAVTAQATAAAPALKVTETPKPASATALTPGQKKVAVAVAAAAVLVMLFVMVIFYIYSAICIMFVAKKTGKEPAWLAWIPIGNLFLLCKVAGLTYWWLLILFVYIIPVAGPLLFLAFFGYLWYKVALARNKPGWVGILVVIPLVNLIVMGYLAFSE